VNDGFESIMGRFFPSDIGMIGSVFVIGLVGVVIIYAQFYFATVYGSKIIKLNSNHPHMLIAKASIAMLVYMFFSSLINGFILYKPAISLFFLAIIYIIAISKKVNST